MPQRRAPLREHTFRIVMLVVLPLIVLVGGFIIMVTLPGRALPAGALWIPLAVVLVFFAAALALGLFIGKRLVGDRIELAFRAPGGKWRHGRVDISPGILTLQPYWWQLRFRSGDPITLHVNGLGDDTGRRPKPRQWWSLNPQLSIVRLDTDEGEYEVAALPSHLAELRERLLEGSTADRS